MPMRVKPFNEFAMREILSCTGLLAEQCDQLNDCRESACCG